MSKKSKLNRRKAREQALSEFNFPSSAAVELFESVAIDFTGNIKLLESAIGAYIVGQLYGWRVLRMAHGSSTYAKYEKLLGIKFGEVCPDRGPLADMSVGLNIADNAGGFWKVVTGKIPGRSPEVKDLEPTK